MKTAEVEATKPRKRDYHHGSLKSSLLQAAIDVVVREGPQALSTTRLAADLGVTAPALYRHYASLRELQLAIFTHALRLLIDDMRAARASVKSPAGAPRAIAESIITYGDQHPGFYRLINELEITEERDKGTEAFNAKVELQGIIDEAFMAADPTLDKRRLRHHTLLMHFTIFGFVAVRANLPVDTSINDSFDRAYMRRKLVDFATDLS